ncbi:hypothetical protein, partial [Clostridium perfringens]|uniref:hypothetical protein n=1 Tax=Clostridium perfringens TaxID=1502 RepID=UPI00232C74EB
MNEERKKAKKNATVKEESFKFSKLVFEKKEHKEFLVSFSIIPWAKPSNTLIPVQKKVAPLI